MINHKKGFVCRDSSWKAIDWPARRLYSALSSISYKVEGQCPPPNKLQHKSINLFPRRAFQIKMLSNTLQKTMYTIKVLHVTMERNYCKTLQCIYSKSTETLVFSVSYPRVDKDLFIFAASFKRSPSAPELFCLNQ